jgi:16S rRNA (guanine527-N7)-methyltransferase
MTGSALGADEPTLESAQRLFGESFAQICQFGQCLAADADRFGLLGPREVERLWSRHLANSATLLRFLPEQGQVIDLGSGAGLPGIVLSILRPDLDFELVEAMQRRCQWLEQVVQQLGLSNVTVTNARAENLLDRSVDVVVARAVAPLKQLLRWSKGLLQPNGWLAALKGARASNELAQAAAEIVRFRFGQGTVHSIDVLGDGETTFVVQLPYEG